jgi:hypothetical protein
MKRIGLFLLVLGLCSTGCVPAFLRKEAKPPQVEMAPPPPPTVTEDVVTEQNAANAARALRAEIEYDLAKPAAPATPVAAPGPAKR